MTEWPQNNMNPRRLYRDTENGVCCGVCAGVADYFGFNLRATRLLTILAFIFMPATALIYIGAALLLPRKPKSLYKKPEEEVLIQSVRRDPHHMFHAVRHKFREMEAKLERMERYVTSPRFDLDREFKDLED